MKKDLTRRDEYFLNALKLLKRRGKETVKFLADVCECSPRTIQGVLSGEKPANKSVSDSLSAYYKTTVDLMVIGGEAVSYGSDPDEMLNDITATTHNSQTLRQPAKANESKEIHKPNEGTSDDFKISDMLQAVTRVLESDTVYKPALVSNIRAFDKAVQQEQDVDDLKGKVDILITTMESMKEEMAMMRKGVTEKKLQGNGD